MPFLRHYGGACRHWHGGLDKFGNPTHRVQSGGQWMYLTPRVAVFEVEVNCNLMKGFTLKAACRNKFCCEPGCMSIVHAYSAKGRVYSAFTGVKIGDCEVSAPTRQCSGTGGDILSRLKGGDVSADDIAAEFGVTVEYVKRLAMAKRLNWF